MEEQTESLRRKKEQFELYMEIAASTAKLAVLQASDSSVLDRQSDGIESYFRKKAKLKETHSSVNPYGKKHDPQPVQAFQQHLSLQSDQNNTQPLEKAVTSDHHRNAARSSRQDDVKSEQNMQAVHKSTSDPQQQQPQTQTIQYSVFSRRQSDIR